MAKSDTSQDLDQGLELPCGAAAASDPRKSGMGRIRRRLGRCAAGISTGALGITVAAMAVAQSGGNFKTAPMPPEAEGEAAAASDGIDMILGIPVNTIFFIAAGVIALFWFTLGGGRKPKVSRNS